MSKAAELAALIGSQTALSPSRNFIINGGMKIAQRGTSTASITGSGVFVIDRWELDEVADSTLTMSQETLTTGAAFDAGLNHSLKVLVTTADTSIGSSQAVQLMQSIEAQNLQTLKFGSSGARNLTLSFYYKSNVTGIHTVCIDKIDSTRTTCPLEFTVSSANTWERHTLKAVANSAVQGSSGAIANDNGAGFRVIWGLAYGSDYQSGTSGTWEQNGTASFSTSNQQNIVGAADNYVEVTGVQLEVGDVATAFEHEDIGTTLAKCMRYFQLVDGGVGKVTGLNSNVQMMVQAAFDMRATPSLAVTTLRVTDCTTADYNDATVTVSAANVNLRGGRMNLGMSSTAAVGTTVMLQGTDTNAAPVQLSAEL